MASKRKPSKPSPTKRIEQIDAREQAQLVKSGLAKLGASPPEKLTVRERSAVKAWETEQLERWGRQYVESCPKRDYCDAVGISQKVALEQSRRFGLPYHTAGKTVGLFEQLGAWHAWASEHKHLIDRLIKSKQAAEILGDDEDSLDYWQRELVKERAIKEQDLREERRGELVPREAVHEVLLTVVEAIAKLGQAFNGRSELTGADAATMLRERLEEIDQVIEATFAEPTAAHEDGAEPPQPDSDES